MKEILVDARDYVSESASPVGPCRPRDFPDFHDFPIFLNFIKSSGKLKN